MNSLVTVLVISNMMFQCEVPQELAGKIVIDFLLHESECVLHLPEGLEYIPAKIKLIDSQVSV